VALRVLDAAGAERVRGLCEAIVPAAAATGPEVYVDALLAELPEAERPAARAAREQGAAPAARGELGSLAGTPAFERARLMAVEAYYSDFVARSAAGPGAWERIGFVFPLTEGIRKDWSFMGIEE
jgi:hypothetical protein